MSEIRHIRQPYCYKGGSELTPSPLVGDVVVLQLTVGAAELVAEASFPFILEVAVFASQMVTAVFRTIQFPIQFQGLFRGEQLPALVTGDHPLPEAFLGTAVPVDDPVVVPPYLNIRILAGDELTAACVTCDLLHAVLAEFRDLLLSDDRFQRECVLRLAASADVGYRHDR